MEPQLDYGRRLGDYDFDQLQSATVKLAQEDSASLVAEQQVGPAAIPRQSCYRNLLLIKQEGSLEECKLDETASQKQMCYLLGLRVGSLR